MSWGFSRTATGIAFLRTCIEYANAAGVLMIASTGNTPSTPGNPVQIGYPAAWPEVIAVGSGGLAAALGREVGTLAGPTEVTIDAVEREAPADPASVSDDRPARTVVAVSSQHPISLAQVRKLTAAGLPDTEIVLPQVPGEISLEAAVADFVHRVRAAVRRPGDLDLVLVGGDGAGVILDALGAKALVVRRTLIDGCPLSTILGGDADGMRVVTKSGGFGTAETLVDIVGRLRRPGQRA